MLLRIRHSKDSVPVRMGNKLMVPLSLAEAAANAVNSGKAFEVADGDFVGSDSHDAAVFLMQIVDVKGTPAGHDGKLEGESGEAGVPWSRERAERVSDASVEKLWNVNMAFWFRDGDDLPKVVPLTSS